MSQYKFSAKLFSFGLMQAECDVLPRLRDSDNSVQSNVKCSEGQSTKTFHKILHHYTIWKGTGKFLFVIG